MAILALAAQLPPDSLAYQLHEGAHSGGVLETVVRDDPVAAVVSDLLPDREAELVVYCANAACRNSHIAAAELAKLGYAHVAVYHEGKQDWVEAGLPIETGKASAHAA